MSGVPSAETVPSPSAMSALATLPEPILVVGGYGYRNIGDEAILASLLRALEGRRVRVVSRLPAETAAAHGVPAVPVYRALSALRRHRSVLIGGGGLFGSDMGAVGRLLPSFGLTAVALGRTVALHGIGIDAGLPASTATLLRELARRAAWVMVRDTPSADVLAGWGVSAAIGPDLATWLPAAPRQAGASLIRSAGVDPRRPVVGLALTAVRPDLAEQVLEAADRTMDALPEVPFVFLPMSQHPWVSAHNDLWLARRLQARQPRLRVVDGAVRPEVMMAAFGHLSVVVGMRYHSLLFAARAGVPVVAVPYAEKCHAWLAEHQLKASPPRADAWVRRIRAAPAVEAAS